MLIVSSIQYIQINYKLTNKIDTDTMDSIPLLYVILSIGALYLDMNIKN